MASLPETTPWLTLGGRPLSSRLIVGLEQYHTVDAIRDVMLASKSELVITTVALDQTHTGVPLAPILESLAALDPVVICTTSFVNTHIEALATAQLIRDSLGITAVKLDVRPDNRTPDNGATLRAAESLIHEGFEVLPMIVPDAQVASELERLGCTALRLMAGPVRSLSGVSNMELMLATKAVVKLPCIAEGGIAYPSHVASIMQRGFDAVLVNTAIAQSPNPVFMARAMELAVRSGRLCYLAKNSHMALGMANE